MTPAQLFAEQMGWEENHRQHVGCAIDYFIPDGGRAEVKEDHRAARTGNFYFEYAQTWDGWITSQWSGLFLAFEQADLFVVFVEYTAYVFETKTLLNYDPFFQENTPIRATKASCNGNRPGAFSAGIVAPAEEIIPLACEVYELRDGVWVPQES